MLHVLEHSLLDSLKIFIFVFVLFFLISFIEKKINKVLSSNNKLTPLYGALFGLIPQCGISVEGSDLYLKRRITLGTLMAIFIACNDEAIFILLASDKFLSGVTLLVIKLILGFIFGFIIDLFITKKVRKKKDDEIDVDCCHHHHHIKSDKKFVNQLLHSLSHALEIFIYVFIVNFIFGTLIHFIGENTLILFLEKNKYLSPLFSSIIGLIPNCSSSIVISELFVLNGISFGALLGGLTMNAGIGLIYLFKKKEQFKNSLFILISLFIISLVVGYVTCLILGF